MSDGAGQMRNDRERRRFWRHHALLPAIVFAGVLTIVIAGDLDLRIADALFFNQSTSEWIGAYTWWAYDLIHTGGSVFVRLVGVGALVVLALGFWLPDWRRFSRGAAYVALGLALVPATVAGLKQVTNVDCPWNLDRYGGEQPYVRLLADRPDELPQGKCFPGSHSSSGFALMAFYFAVRGRRPRAARWLLAGTVLIGVIFSFGQQARGAHFLSHDLTSAAIAWFLLLALWRIVIGFQDPGRQPSVASSSANPAT